MIFFPNAKINLGLRITSLRPDGYHDLDTLMLPVGWCDVLEMIPAATVAGSFRQIGGPTDCPVEKNLVIKALRALEAAIGHKLPPLDIVLEKHIPFGAGLGGGSADAAFAIRGANEIFGLGLDDETMAAVAVRVGADCPFFIYNRPMHATGIGEILCPADVSALSRYTVVVAKPVSEAVSTAVAYAGVCPRPLDTGTSLTAELSQPVSEWMTRGVLVNDFERSVFAIRPEIAALKNTFLNSGAEYASMSGSGAAVFAFFASAKMAEDAADSLGNCEIFVDKHFGNRCMRTF